MAIINIVRISGFVALYLKVQVGNYPGQLSGKDAIRKTFPQQKPRWEKTTKTEVGKTKLTIRYLYLENIVPIINKNKMLHKPSEQLFPNRRSLST